MNFEMGGLQKWYPHGGIESAESLLILYKCRHHDEKLKGLGFFDYNNLVSGSGYADLLYQTRPLIMDTLPIPNPFIS